MFGNNDQLTAPLLNLRELSFTGPSVPEACIMHREHHGAPKINPELFLGDLAVWPNLTSVSPGQAAVLVHVLTRFKHGLTAAKPALHHLIESTQLAGRCNWGVYLSAAGDTQFMIDTCENYLRDVANTPVDQGAITPNFNRLFNDVFPARISMLEQALKADDRTAQIIAEAKLRTVYHIIGEGLGAITGIWGLNAACREIKDTHGIELNGLAALTGQITLIMRRNIAFGLSEMVALARESYWNTVPTALKELGSIRPILDGMRSETFNRNYDSLEMFPFHTIREDRISKLGARRVLSWLFKFGVRQNVRRFEEII